MHLLCQGGDRPVGVAADRVAGSAIDADLSIGDRVVTYSVTRLKEQVYGVRCTVNVVVFEGDPANPEYLLTDSYIGYRFRDK